jgi:hypothetical protein
MRIVRIERDAAALAIDPDEAGGSLPELLVAGALILVALGMVAGTVIAPMDALSRVGAADEVHVRLENAADTASRIVRASRATIDGPPVISTGPQALHLRTGDPALAETTLLVLEDGRLTAHVLGAGSASSVDPLVIVEGLDMGRSSLRVRSRSGADVEMNRLFDAVAVEMQLHAEGRTVSRVVSLRGRRT